MEMIVLFYPEPLLLKRVNFNGIKVKSGKVVNGGWRLEIDEKEMRACFLELNDFYIRGNKRIANRWPNKGYSYCKVTKQIENDNYNDIINWALKRKAENDWNEGEYYQIGSQQKD